MPFWCPGRNRERIVPAYAYRPIVSTLCHTEPRGIAWFSAPVRQWVRRGSFDLKSSMRFGTCVHTPGEKGAEVLCFQRTNGQNLFLQSVIGVFLGRRNAASTAAF